MNEKVVNEILIGVEAKPTEGMWVNRKQLQQLKERINEVITKETNKLIKGKAKEVDKKGNQ